MIFITTGSRNFQFNRLLKAVDEAVSEGIIQDKVFAQIGASDYKIQNYGYTEFMNHDEFNQQIYNCDIVVTHGGTGVIVNSVKAGKHVVAVPRLPLYGEVVDDHQIELIKVFEKLDMVVPCYDCTSKGIAEAIQNAKQREMRTYISNTNVIISSIDDYIISR